MEFFEAEDRPTKDSSKQVFQKIVLLIVSLAAVVYFGVRQEYVAKDESSGVVRIFTINRLTGIVCKTTFFSGKRPAEKECR